MPEDDQSAGAPSSETLQQRQQPPPSIQLLAPTSIGSWIYFALLALIALSLAWNLPVLSRLSDPSFARGVITFIIIVATIGLAFILVSQAFTPLSTDEHFRRAREVFAGLMGVLGTIVGFYFGSADKPPAALEIGTIKAADKQLLTYASGGSRPYRYLITSTDKDFKEIKKTSEDGWIVEILEQAPKAGSTITVEVTDNKEQKILRRIEFPGDLKPEGAPLPPRQPQTTPQPTGPQEPGKPPGS